MPTGGEIEMTEEDIRFFAQVQAKAAEMWAAVAEMEGMIALNAERESRGYSLAYSDEAFEEVRRRLADIARAFNAL